MLHHKSVVGDLDLPTNPGFHPKFDPAEFPPRLHNVLRQLSRIFYITRGFPEIWEGNSRYYACLMRPVDQVQPIFGFEQEFPCLFSTYETFEFRTLDAFDEIFRQVKSRSRVNERFRFVISDDPTVKNSVKKYLQRDLERPNIVPFHTQEFFADNEKFVLERVREFFHTRDLFDFRNPLQTELYFFGRNQLINKIVSRHGSGEANALFGLRRSGKTSVIYAVQRAAAAQGHCSVIIDCQEPTHNQALAWELLRKILIKAAEKFNVPVKRIRNALIDEKSTFDNIKEQMNYLVGQINKDIMFIFDEIERISPDVGQGPFRDPLEFTKFWQTLRALQQEGGNKRFTVFLVGTNSAIIETRKFGQYDNPLFEYSPNEYLRGLNLDDLESMVKTLGNFMGLEFPKEIVSHLHNEFGGHPYLVRQVCSIIHHHAQDPRPIGVQHSDLTLALETFAQKSEIFVREMIKQIQELYPDEFYMCQLIAAGKTAEVEDLSVAMPETVRHLIGYGLLRKTHLSYEFAIEAVARYFASVTSQDIATMSQQARRRRIGELYNEVECALRKCFGIWLSFQGTKFSIEPSLKYACNKERGEAFSSTNYRELLGDNSDLYFLELAKMIKFNYSQFENRFSMSKEDFWGHCEIVNSARRVPAHSKVISDSDFRRFIIAAEALYEVAST